MLCFEGIALNLKVFLGLTELPDFCLKTSPQDGLQTLSVDPAVRLGPLSYSLPARLL